MPLSRRLQKLLDKASAQIQAGKYKAAADTLLYVEPLVRGGEYSGANDLLDLAEKLRENMHGGARDECERFVASAQEVIRRDAGLAERVGPLAVSFAPALCLGVYPDLSQDFAAWLGAGVLWITAEWIGIGTQEGEQLRDVVPMSAVDSVDIRRRRRVIHRHVLDGSGDDPSEVVVLKCDGELVHFLIDRQSPGHLRTAMSPLLESVGVPFTDPECAERAREAARQRARTLAEKSRMDAQEARAWEQPIQIGELDGRLDGEDRRVTLVLAPSGQHFLLGDDEVPAGFVVECAVRGDLRLSNTSAREIVGTIAATTRPTWTLTQTTSNATDAQMAELFASGQKSVDACKYSDGFSALREAAPWALTHAPDGLFDVLGSIPKDDRAPFEGEYQSLLRCASYWVSGGGREVDEVRECTILGCSDDSYTDLLGSVQFKSNGIYFAEKSESGRDLFCPRLFARYEDVVALQIGGPGRETTGGGFIGGGFGVEGAITGMLVATGLNLLTTRTRMSTVMCVQTRNGEMFLGNKSESPDQLRMRLAEVITLLRQKHESAVAKARTAHESESSADSGPLIQPMDYVGQLTKLAELHRSGALSDEEFAAFKTKLME